MKIAIVIKDCAFANGGAERYASRLLWRLAETKEQEVHLFSNSWDLKLEERAQCHFVPYKRKPGFLKQRSFAKNVREQLKKYHFDLVLGLTQFLPMDIFRTGGGFYASYLEKRYLNPKTHFIKRWAPKAAFMIQIENKIVHSKKVYGFMANSHMCRDELIQRFGVDEKRIKVIYNSIDRNVFNPLNMRKHRKEIRGELNIADDEIVLLFVGNGFGRKNLETVIKTAQHLKPQLNRFRFIVIGKGRIDWYRKKAKDLEVESRFLFLGPQEKIIKWYHAADALIHPAIYEPCSNACLEALASGLPVMTTETNGASYWICEGVNGFVVKDPRDAQAFAQKAVLLLETAKREKMRHDAPATVEKLTDPYHDKELIDFLNTTFAFKRKVERLNRESPFYVKN